MLSASCDGLIHFVFFDVCFIIVVFNIKWSEFALIKAHLLMTIFRWAFVVFVTVVVDNQRWIIKQSLDDKLMQRIKDKEEEKKCCCMSHRNVVSFSFSPSNMCLCCSTKKLMFISTPSASDCNKRVVRFLKSLAISAMCSRNPGKGCWQSFLCVIVLSTKNDRKSYFIFTSSGSLLLSVQML